MLVHACCAPDALYVLSLLKEEFEVTAFFYNPNIHPEEEYILRADEARRVADILRVPLLVGPYDVSRWLALTEKFKDEPEKGRRCDICYAMRLEQTARRAASSGFDYFATVMSLSPWKKADVLNRLGRMFGRRYRILYLEANFKKKDGFRKSIELSRAHGLYRQNYCGCLYSQRSFRLKSKERKSFE